MTHVLESRTLQHVATLHGSWEPAVFASYSDALGRAYNEGLWGVERNNHGHTVLYVADKELHYPRLYWHQQEQSRQRGQGLTEPTERLGFPMTRTSKATLIDGLAEAISTYALASLDAGFWSEAQTYVRGPNGETEASEGNHDDRVIAMAGCVWLTKQPGATALLARPRPRVTHYRWSDGRDNMRWHGG